MEYLLRDRFQNTLYQVLVYTKIKSQSITFKKSSQNENLKFSKAK